MATNLGSALVRAVADDDNGARVVVESTSKSISSAIISSISDSSNIIKLTVVDDECWIAFGSGTEVHLPLEGEHDVESAKDVMNSIILGRAREAFYLDTYGVYASSPEINGTKVIIPLPGDTKFVWNRTIPAW